MKSLKTGLSRLLGAGLLAALGVSSSIALADGGLDWTTWIPDNSTQLFEAKTSSQGVSTLVSATRGPISGGVCNLRAQITTNATGLQSMRLLMANDTNSDGTIQTSEWQVVGNATITPGSGGNPTTADTGWIADVPATRAAYRIEHTWQGGGMTYDDILDSALETQ